MHKVSIMFVLNTTVALACPLSNFVLRPIKFSDLILLRDQNKNKIRNELKIVIDSIQFVALDFFISRCGLHWKTEIPPFNF